MGPKKRAKVYQRSFVGCWTCRRRKIKCDATRPQCLRCAKSKLHCEGYDIKLNWSNPLVVKNGEMIFNEEEVEETSTAFQRSNIALCKWNLYKYYEDIDDDIEKLGEYRNQISKIGPFTMFRYKPESSKSSPVSSSPTSAREMISGPSMHTIPSSSVSVPLSTPKTNAIHSQLIKFAKISIFVKNLPDSTPLKYPLPQTTTPLINSPKILQHLFKDAQDSIMITNKFKHSINHFITLIPKLFNTTSPQIINHLETVVKSSLGEFILHQQNQDLQLLLNVTTLSLISKLDQTPALLPEITNLYKMASSSFPRSTTTDTTTLSLIIQIMITTTLGIYDPTLFQHQTTLKSHCSFIYQFLWNTNQLINSSHFKLDKKYSKIYEDLNQSYNLLKNIHTKRDKKNFKNGYGMILINTKATPRDQIMRVPKYVEEDDEDDIPPSFTINFSHAEDEEDSESEEQEQEESLDGDHHHGIEPTTATALFTFDDMTNPMEESAMGVSRCLLYLFENLVKLLNHKRIFNSLGQTSRNFPKVCADFEDVLHKANEMIQENANYNLNDNQFYNCLILLYYKQVRNYPSHLLNYHFNALSTVDDTKLGLVWFVKYALGEYDINGLKNQGVLFNNWEAKQFLEELKQRDSNGDWDVIMKSENFNDFFVL